MIHFKFKMMLLLYCSQSHSQVTSGGNDNRLNLPKSFIVPKSLVHHYYNYYNQKAVKLDNAVPVQDKDNFKNINSNEICLNNDKDLCTKAEFILEDNENSAQGNLYRRSIEGLEEMFEQSGAQVLRKLGGVMNQVVQSKDQMMKSLDDVMGRVSESVLESKDRVIKGFDSVMDKVSESKSKMMEEIDYVLDNLAHSKVMEEIRALPREIKESFVLSVRNKSYIAAGIMVAMTTAILIAGALYYAWCHQDNWNYCIVPLEEIPHTTNDVIKHMNTKFADGSAVNKGITSCFVSNSAKEFRTKSKIFNKLDKHCYG